MDSVTEVDFHIFEYCIVSKIFPAVIEEIDCTSGLCFFAPGNFRTGFSTWPGDNCLFSMRLSSQVSVRISLLLVVGLIIDQCFSLSRYKQGKIFVKKLFIIE